MPQEILHGADGLPLMSRSSLEAALCGHRYNALYNEGMEDDSPWSLRGTAYHEVKRTYVKLLAAHQVPMDADLAKQAFQLGIGFCKTPPQLVPDVQNIWGRHTQHFELNLDWYYAAEEKRVRVDAVVPYQYKPDLEYVRFHEGVIEVFDDKSYYRAFTEVQARELVQTRFYMWAAIQEFPNFEHYWFTYNFVRLNRSVTVKFTRDDFETLDVEIRAMDAARRKRHADKDWQANAGDPCGYCNLQCPLVDDPSRAYVRVNDDVSAHENGSLIIVLEKELNRRKAAQKQYVNLYGAHNINGEVFDFRLSKRVTYPGNGVVDTVRALGEEPNFRVSRSGLKALFKRMPHLEDDLAPMAEEKETAKFGHKSVKADMREARPDDEDDEE